MNFRNGLNILMETSGLGISRATAEFRKRLPSWQVSVQLLFFGSIIGIAGCANLNTVGRSTSLPMKKTTIETATETAGSGKTSKTTKTEINNLGKAVHLDIYQRLLIVNNLGKYCSEPSPDALSAFAAAAGFGAGSEESQAKLQAVFQGMGASVGLRTQSITLMREALFRMCEAYANGAVGPAQIVALLNRSQDLTAVILAIEQLTGAVVANQASLTGSAVAGTSATAVAAANLLEKALEAENKQLQKLNDAKIELNNAETKFQEAKDALEEAEESLGKLPKDTTEEKKKKAQEKVKHGEKNRDAAKLALENAKTIAGFQQKTLNDTQSTREKIQNLLDAAIADFSLSAKGDAEFKPVPAQRIQLDKSASEQVVKSVEKLVMEVLRKDYTIDSCMAIITTVPMSDKEATSLEKTKEHCMSLMDRTVISKIDSFEYDYASEKITEYLYPEGVENNVENNRDETAHGKIQKCMERLGITTGPGRLAELITGSDIKTTRARIAVAVCLGLM